jgi:hypothetical protein
MPRERNETRAMGGERRVHRPDAEISSLAGRQHGVVSRSQLKAAGLGDGAIELRIAAGRLHRIHRGVYAVGHANLAVQGRWMAAVLAGPPGTVLSHRPAGSHWGMRRWRGLPAVTTPTRRRPNPAIEIHSSPLPADERTVLGGIPITTVPRTLLDLATILDHDALVHALNEAEIRGLGDALPLPALLERHRGERGAGALRRALADPAFARGVAVEALEERFASFIRRRGLPPPLLNAPVEACGRTYVADCLWPQQRVIVELQGARYHGTARAMAHDAERTRRLTLAGWTVVYVTWAQLGDRAGAGELAGDLCRLLRRPARRSR